MTGGFLGPAIAAISLGLVGHSALAERLGRNQRFASTGALVGAALMGVAGYLLSYQSIFLIVVLLGLPLFLALARIRAADVHFGRSCGAPAHHDEGQPARSGRWILLKDFRLVVFAGGLFMFQLANASVLPLAGEILARKSQTHSSLVISALIIVPQIIVALMAPWVGRRAQDWGRRPLLLIGFAALPIRALGFALISDPLLLLAVQALDGISATVLGVLTALIIADLTGGTGRFNLAQGIVGTASGIGASISTTLSGLVAERLGPSAAFLCIAATAALGTLMIWFLMPETKPPTERTETDGQSVGHAYVEKTSSVMERNMAFKIQVGPPQISIHQGQTILISELDGQINWPSDKGLFFRDTRVISNWSIYANGEPWTLLNGGAITYYAARIFLTNRVFATESGTIPERALGLTIGRWIAGGVHEDIEITNNSMRRVSFQLEISVRSDFADLLR